MNEGARIADAVASASSRRGFLSKVGAAVMGVAGARDHRIARGAGRGRGVPLLRAHLLRLIRDRTPPGCRGSTRAGSRSGRATGAGWTTSVCYIDAAGGPVDDDGFAAAGRRRHAAAERVADSRVRRRGRGLRLPALRGRRLVSLLRWPRTQAGRLLRHVRDRINGDKALKGDRYQGRKVFCVMYYETKVKC